ncbi:MAG TPA: hypothetical protein VLM76_09525 [Patescibacteria group bacterium]|nr:hypothetical protein [Patescibacteria group bacterium]
MKLMTMLHANRAYQATDLARNHRQVVDDARDGFAIIRDKDGATLVMTTASVLERAQEIGGTAVALVQVAQALAEPADRRTTSAYGDFAWLRPLPEDAQRRFLAEVTDQLLVVASGGRLDQLTELVGDWLATAEAWADADTREALLADERAPLLDVAL